MTAEILVEENRRRHKQLSDDNALWTRLHCCDNGEDATARFENDFAYWAFKCVKIRDKKTGRRVPFMLNRAQRKLLAELERMRLDNRPIRVILLKSRQWGGSTLIQIYMAWIQMLHRENWNSLICAQVKDTATTIRSMFNNFLDDYPEEYLADGVERPRFKAVERSTNIRELTGRGCRVTIGSAESQESSRGCDYQMAHLSEVAFWKKGTRHDPNDFMRAVTGGILPEPYTLIALESTANGTGDFFHSEWKRAEAGKSAYKNVFVAWHEAEMNEIAIDNPLALWNSLSEYEQELWTSHPLITLEQLSWYHFKSSEATCHEAMMAEYPSDADEAFVNSGTAVFTEQTVDALRPQCCDPTERGAVRGRCESGHEAISGVRFYKDEKCVGGYVDIWARPRHGWQYVVAVDVGGRHLKSDYSVIAVLGRSDADAPTEVVAQWRGHIDHDLLAWRAAAMATYYNKALLVIESNTLESDIDADGHSSAIILQRLNHVYPRLYRRVREDAVTRRPVSTVGFHTNRRTKSLIIGNLIATLREGRLLERDIEACNEMSWYENKQNGAYGAVDGRHDDILMTRAIGLYVFDEKKPIPPDLTSSLKCPDYYL